MTGTFRSARLGKHAAAVLVLVAALLAGPARAQEKAIVGLIPKAQKPIQLDGKLDDWEGAFVTPVHVGHPDFANRGGQVLFLWDEQNLYIGLRCLDQKPAHVGPGPAKLGPARRPGRPGLTDSKPAVWTGELRRPPRIDAPGGRATGARC